MKKFIAVTLEYEGIHQWSDAPKGHEYYLRFPHRHLFKISAIKEVNHNNRDIEIIGFKREIFNYLDSYYCGEFGDMSCEDIAEDLVEEFGLSQCSVLEDNENGAIICA